MISIGAVHVSRSGWCAGLLVAIISFAGWAHCQDDPFAERPEPASSQAASSADESEVSPGGMGAVGDSESDSSDEFSFDETSSEQEISTEEFIEEFLGPREDPSPTEIALMLSVYGVILAIMLAIKFMILWFLRSFLLALPPDYRLFQPNQVWLAFIPCFSLVWNFIIYNGVSQSYRTYFHQQGRIDVGDCGQMIGMLFCSSIAVATFGGAIPCVGGCISVPLLLLALVFLIVYMVQISSLKAQITRWEQEPKWQ